MMKMLIQIDEQKVIADRKYNLEKMWAAIDAKFTKYNCIKERQSDGSVVYTGNPQYDYFTGMGLAYLSLKKQQWFANYCLKWVMLDNEDDETLPFQNIDMLARQRRENPIFAV